MRQMHLIHGDIKPENIMYSPWQGKVVLVDFGLAKFIKEKAGQKTRTCFRGTRGWVGQDMQELYHRTEAPGGFVNLYKNDM